MVGGRQAELKSSTALIECRSASWFVDSHFSLITLSHGQALNLKDPSP
jgi:hypothetical protein